MHDGSPVFRSATIGDANAVIELLNAANLPTAGVDDMFAHDASQFLIATDKGDVLAVAGIEVCCNNALLRSVAVREDWQRKGLGQTLVKRAVCEAEARGIQALYLLTMTSEHYFPRFGFEIISRDQVPREVAATLEFTSACPASATVMAKVLAPLRESTLQSATA